MQPELMHDPACVDLLLLVLPLDDHKGELRLVPDKPRPDLMCLSLPQPSQTPQPAVRQRTHPQIDSGAAT